MHATQMKANGTMIKRCELFVALFKANTWKLNAIYENWYKAYFKSLELSFSILTNAPHEASWTAIGLLRYWTTASPVMLPAVAAWNVLPFFFYCSGISAGWKTRLISGHPWRFLWDPSDHWLFHGIKPWLAAEKEELNQSQFWKGGVILLKWKVVF